MLKTVYKKKIAVYFKVTVFTLHFSITVFLDPLMSRDSQCENTGVDGAVWVARTGVK
jgi:hypothetical protein